MVNRMAQSNTIITYYIERTGPNTTTEMDNKEIRKTTKARHKQKAKGHKHCELMKERAALQRALERNKTQRKNLRYNAQLFENIFDLPRHMNGALNGIEGMTTSVKQIADLLLGKIEQISQMFNIPDTIDLVALILNGVALFQAISIGDKTGAFFSFLSFARSSQIDISKWTTLFLNIIKDAAIQLGMFTGYIVNEEPTNVTEYHAQMFDFPRSETLNVIGTLMITFTSMICGADKNYTYSLKHLGDFGRAAVGWNKVTDLLEWFKNFFLDCYYRFKLGKTKAQLDMETKYPKLEIALKRSALLLSSDFQTSYLARDAELCELIVKLDEDMNDILMSATRSRDTDTVTLIRSEMMRIKKIVELARSSAASSHKTREAPFALYVYGESGVGKTNLINYIKADIYRKKYLNDPNWNINTFAHTRCSENEYWDGMLSGQPLVLYDDIFQKGDTTANPNPEYMEIIRAVNEAAYHLHMSSVDDKKDCYFTAKYIIGSSNVKQPKPVSLSFPEALLRRWGLAIDVGVNAEFGETRGKSFAISEFKVNQYKKEYMRKHKIASEDECPELAFIKEIYCIDVYSMFDGSIIQANLTLDEFMEVFWKTSESKLEKSKRLNAAIALHCGLETSSEDSGFVDFTSKFKAQIDEKKKPSKQTKEKYFGDKKTTSVKKYTPPTLAEHEQQLLAIDQKHRNESKIDPELLTEAPYLSAHEYSDEEAEEVKGTCKLSWQQPESYNWDPRLLLSDYGTNEVIKKYQESMIGGIRQRNGAQPDEVQSHGMFTRDQIIYLLRHEEKLLIKSHQTRTQDQADNFETDDTSFEARMARFHAWFAQTKISTLLQKIYIRYTQSFNKENIKNCLADCLCRILTSPLFATGIYIISAQLFKADKQCGMFTWGKCTRLTALKKEQMKYAECERSCCKDITSIFPLGTSAYAYEILEKMQSRIGYTEQRAKWMDELREGYLEEIIERRIQKHNDMTEKLNNLGFRAESREINTRYADKTRYAESREINTRYAGKPKYAESREIQTRYTTNPKFAESRETQTRGLGKTYRAETRQQGAPLYESENGLTSGLKYVGQMSDTVQLEQWNAITYKNSVILKNSYGGKVNGVFLQGRILLTVNHFVESVQSGDGKFVIIAPNNSEGNIVALNQCKYQQMTDALGNIMDLALLAIPNQPSRRDIVSKFHRANDMAYIHQGNFVLGGLRDINNITSAITFNGHKLTELGNIEYSFRNKILKVSQAIGYDIDTKAGDCGALVYTKSKFFAGKIVGVHVCGAQGEGVAAVVSFECISRNLAQFSGDLPSRFTVNGKLPYSAELEEGSYCCNSKCFKVPDITDSSYFNCCQTFAFCKCKCTSHMKLIPKLNETPPKDTLTKIGNCLSLGTLLAPFAPTKTNLRPSLVSGTLQEPTTKPAFLKPVEIDGKVVDPMVKGVSKVLNTSRPLDLDVLRVCVKDIESMHVTEKYDENGRDVKRVLTFQEAIEGAEEQNALNRTTSAGYPWSMNTTEPGKRKWLGYDEYTYDPIVEHQVTDLIENCKRNIRGNVVWTAHLKDERRPIAKVNEGKTRVFTGGPMHFTIAFRMYFLSFIEHVMDNRINNEIGVGTNPYGLDWHKTGLSLSKFGNKVIAGDFSNFDGSLNQEILWNICDMINDWYDDGAENRLIRSVLFEEICNARVLVRGELVQWDHSQPSGNPGTVIFNSLFNQIVMRYAYLMCKEAEGLPRILDFTENVSMQTFGDDNCLNISENVIDWYNQLTITEALSTIGLTYTDEAKTGELVTHRTLQDIAYLKRGFERDQNGYFQGPLDKNTVLEMTNWIRGLKTDGTTETYENCEAAIREAYFHGESFFNEVHSRLTAALRANGVKTRLPEFFEMKEFYAHQYFG